MILWAAVMPSIPTSKSTMSGCSSTIIWMPRSPSHNSFPTKKLELNQADAIHCTRIWRSRQQALELGGALTITRRPQEISWLYKAVAHQRGLPPLTQAQTLAPDRVFPADAQSIRYIHLADGKSFTVWDAPENTARLLQVLARRAPHAQIGYNPLLEKQ
jgi:hypothetical protein